MGNAPSNLMGLVGPNKPGAGLRQLAEFLWRCTLLYSLDDAVSYRLDASTGSSAMSGTLLLSHKPRPDTLTWRLILHGIDLQPHRPGHPIHAICPWASQRRSLTQPQRICRVTSCDELLTGRGSATGKCFAIRLNSELKERRSADR